MKGKLIRSAAAAVTATVICLGMLMTGCSDSDNSSKKADSSKAQPLESSSAAEPEANESSLQSQAEPEAEPAEQMPTNIVDGIDYLTLVTHGHKLPDDWEDTIQKVTFVNGQGYEVTIEKKAYDAYMELKEDLEKDGIYVDVDTGYRSVAEQVEIRQRYRERYGTEYAEKYVAVPGYSEHHTGLAIDLYLIVDGEPVIYNEDLVKYTDIWEKIHAKLADHGFILRFTEEKEDVTKFDYEPWHIRYVGVEPAKEITESGQALEEYLGVTIGDGEDVYEEPTAPVNTETIYQVALLQSLAQGFYDGIISVDALKEKGDIGIGTFDGVNGEMIVLDGEVYRADADGNIEKPEGDEMIPFSTVTFFEPDMTAELKDIKDIDSLKAELDKIVEPNRNMFVMVRIDGEFNSLKARSESKQEKPYKMLDEALAESQNEFDFKDVKGTIVGLYCPDYMSDLNSVGWHFHFISEDLTKGGHVLGLDMKQGQTQLDITPGFKMYMFDSEEFQKLELSKDVDKVIESAETKSVKD